MEFESGFDREQLELPPGFRFHPTDEELITHYLSNKVFDPDFSAVAIGEVDMNKIEPWELPCEWFNFSISILFYFFKKKFGGESMVILRFFLFD